MASASITRLFVLASLLAACAASRARSACSDPLYWSGQQNVSITVQGQERTFRLYTPWAHRPCNRHDFTCGVGPPNESAPLVLHWHGCNGHLPLLDYNLGISKIEEAAADRGYFVITPVGTRSATGPDYGWNTDGIWCGGLGTDDFRFFEALLEFAETKLCVDMSRVYSTGFSTGAFLTYGIACRYPDRIAAAATVAGSLSRLYADACALASGSVPVQAFHSHADPDVPYNGTLQWKGQEEMNALWRRKNGCNGTEPARTTLRSATTVCRRWDCPAAPVESCALDGIDHCWYGGRSGGFPSCRVRRGDVDATTAMFDLWEELASTRADGN